MFPFDDVIMKTAQLFACAVNSIVTDYFAVHVTRKLAGPILTSLLSILKSAEADNQGSPEDMQDKQTSLFPIRIHQGGIPITSALGYVTRVLGCIVPCLTITMWCLNNSCHFRP